MDPALGLGLGDPLHPVHAGLPAEQAEGVGAAHGEDCLFDPAEIALADRNRFDREPVAFGVPGIHPRQLRGEEPGLVPPGARPDFHDGVAVIVRVLGNDQLVQLGLEGGDGGRQACEIGSGQRDKLGIGLLGQFPSLFQIILQAGEALRRLDDGGEPGVFASQRLELGGIPRDLRVGQRMGDLLRAGERLAESAFHRLRLGRRRLVLVLAAEAVHSAGGVHQALFAREERVALAAHFDVDGRGR